MTYSMKPLACDPQRINGMSERLIVSYYENNYGGAVKRLNATTDQLASLDFATAPVFVVNGLKREELIAANSMILHELFFASLGDEGEPGAGMREALARDFGSVDRCDGRHRPRRVPAAAARLGLREVSSANRPCRTLAQRPL